MIREEKIKMSEKEVDRLSIMKQVDKKMLTLLKASEEIGVSFRQVKRIRKKYLQDGVKGLCSKRIGQPNANKIPENLRNTVVNLIKKNYSDFGPTLASEKLLERHQIKMSSETLRKWMIEECIWKSKNI